MYILDKKVVSTENGTVNFEDGTTRTCTDEELSFLLSEEPSDPGKLAYVMERKMVEVIFGCLSKADMQMAFGEDEQARDQSNVDMTAEVIKVCTTYNFPVSRIKQVFGYVKQYVGMIENIVNNNIAGIEDGLFVQFLEVQNLGATDRECLDNATFNDYAKASKKNQ